MLDLYPKLFKLLWYSTLPCYELPVLSKEFMIKSCELAGEEVNCKDMFQKVPTDLGMCCAFNTGQTLKDSNYRRLITDMQESTEYSKENIKRMNRIDAEVGIDNGLKFTLDLQSNSESFGTVLPRCTPWFLPHVSNSSVCDPWAERQFI